MQNGTVIEGNFSNGEFVGDAKITYGNGDSYIGGFEGGEKNGYGEYFSQNMEYKGYFLNNAYQGVGQLVDKIKRQIIAGDFVEGKPTGHVSITDLEGNQLYIGEMDKGVRHGAGQADGDDWVYNGSWVHGQWNGHGSLCLKNKPWVYQGNFKQGEREVIPNKILFSAFREEWIDPDAPVIDPKKDDKSKKPQTLQKDPSKDSPTMKKANLGVPGTSSNTNSHSQLPTDSNQDLQKKLVRHLENIPEGDIKIHAGSKEGLNLIVKIVYQGPDYPDPNPPPPDPKKKPAVKRGAKDAPEEPEIPMITPPPVLLKEESGRQFRVELFALNDDGSLGASHKVDYRHDLQAIENLMKEKESIEQKVKDIKGETPTSRRNILVKKATLTKIEDHNLNLYSTEIHDAEKPLKVSTTGGVLEIVGLRYPENFPGGTYRVVITDLSPRAFKFVENLGKKTLDFTVIAKDQPDPKDTKKKTTTTQTKKK